MILRWDVPVDGADHEIPCGAIIHVDCRDARLVTFWADDFQPTARTLRVFATGEHIDPYWFYVGTGLSPATSTRDRGYFVWHLFELGAER